jgi:hypothetical protein
MSSFQPYDPNAQTDDNGFEPPADGKHKGVTLTDATALTSKAGNDGVLLKFKTTDGYEWAVWQGFKSEAQSAMTWSQVSQLGVDPMQISDLEQLNTALKPHVGTYYDVTVKTNGDYRNTTVDGVSLGENPGVQQQVANGAPAAAATAGAVDDPPF